MGLPGSRVAFTATMILALLLGIAGLIQILSPSSNSLLGIVLILAALALSSYAKNARAAHLHQQKMTGLWQWAQGLGPRDRQGKRRP